MRAVTRLIDWIMETFDYLKVALLVRIGWRLFPGKFTEAIRRFEATEEDSSWHLLRGAVHATDPRHRAELFEQALEEISHAEEFRHFYRQYTGAKIRRMQEEKRILFGKNETWRLFAFCLVGENDAAERFGKIAAQNFSPELNRLLKRILADEKGHQKKAETLLAECGVSETAMNREILAIRLRRLREAWLRSGRQIADLVASIILTVVYLLFSGPFCMIARRRLRDSAGSDARVERLEVANERPRPVI